MIYPKLGVKIGAGKTPGIYHPVVGVLKTLFFYFDDFPYYEYISYSVIHNTTTRSMLGSIYQSYRGTDWSNLNGIIFVYCGQIVIYEKAGKVM